MRKIKDVLRLSPEPGLGQRGIAHALNPGLGTVSTYLKRAREAGIAGPLSAEIDERTLGRVLFPSQPVTRQRRFIEPDFPGVCQELRRKGVPSVTKTPSMTMASLSPSNIWTVKPGNGEPVPCGEKRLLGSVYNTFYPGALAVRVTTAFYTAPRRRC